MKPAYLRSLLSCSTLTLCAMTMLSCAQDREDINTVQPNYTKKSELLGREWYLRTTVVSTNFANANSFPGNMGKLERGVFEVQEKALFFYRTYEFQVGSEVYAKRSDVDIPLKDKNGKLVEHAVPQDLQLKSCAKDDQCRVGSHCGSATRSDKWNDEEDYAGYCVSLGKQYIYHGAPLIAFPISSHFDIMRSYSTASGEQTNKIVENASDRHWYDRDYMRVSWGSNQIVDYDADVLYSHGQTVIYQGDTAPEGEQFEMGVDTTWSHDTNGQKYFTYVTHQILNAPLFHFTDGVAPACLLPVWYVGAAYNCSSEEYAVRTFFLEVPKFEGQDNKKYVAREQDDVELQKFGFFRTERPTYDIQYGNIFSNNVRRTQRHRIWDQYVKKMEDGANGTKVWKGDFDYTQMMPEPIVYYMNEEHPRELVRASIEIAKLWSEPFESVIKFAKPDYKLDHPMFVLCENSDAAAQAAIDKGYKQDDALSPIVAAPTVGGDIKSDSGTISAGSGEVAQWSGTAIGKRFCKNMDTVHRFGDLRYSVMHTVNAPIQAGLYGYGPSAADPLSGEIISASAHAYVGVMKSGAEAALQALELQAGIKDFNDIKRQAEKKYIINAKLASHYDVKGPKSIEEVQGLVANMLDPSVRQNLGTLGVPREDNGGTWAQSRMARVQQNPTLDAMLVSADDGNSIQAMFNDYNVKPDTQALAPEQLKRMSLANWANIAGHKEKQKVLLDLGVKTVHFADFVDNALVGLAEEYGRQYDAALCQAYANAETTTLFNKFSDAAATGPECATVGEFESQGQAKGRVCVASGDKKTRWANCSTRDLMAQLRFAIIKTSDGQSLASQAVTYNFLPGPLYSDTIDPVIRATQEVGRAEVAKLRERIRTELWQRIYKGTQEHEVGHTLGLRHNFEASTDALNFHKEFWTLKTNDKGEVVNPFQSDTIDQSRGHIREKQLASVMDYTSKFNGRFADLGYYDRAAIKFGYGNIVEAFKTPLDMETSPGNGLAPLKQLLATPKDDNPNVVLVQNHGVQDINKLTRRVHYYNLPKYFGSVAAMYDRKDVKWRDLKGNACTEATVGSDCAVGSVCRKLGESSYCADPKLSEVPYRFCSDEWNGQTPTCATFDEGADPYEISRNALEDYENYWYFWGYARDNEAYQPDGYAGRVQRQFYTATRQFQFWMLDYAMYQVIPAGAKEGWWKTRYGKEWDVDPNGGLSGAFATMNSFNTMAQALGRPTPNYFVFNKIRDRFEPYNSIDGQSADAHWIDEPEGARQLYAGWGGGYMYRPVSGGQIYDRLAAFAMLSDPTLPLRNGFMATNETEDTRRYLISFYNAFPRQLTNIFGGIAVEDASYYGWYLLQGPDAAGSQDYVTRPIYVGANSTVPKSCADYDPKVALKDKIGCLKYVIYPDDRPRFPSSRFRMPLLGAYYGMAMLAKGYDRTFLDVSRIFVKGNQNGLQLPDSIAPEDIATFTDPLSGKTYIAPKSSKETVNPGFLSVKLAEKELKKYADLTALQENYLFSEYQFRVSLLDIMRTMYDTYEY